MSVWEVAGGINYEAHIVGGGCRCLMSEDSGFE